ncbi:MAG TPA: DUF2703 domain-containing protein, partial [Bryobacteraceae bacterium]
IMDLDIEILHIEDCPGFPVAVAMVQDVVASMGRKADIRTTLISDPNLPGFAGSPTVLVNGKDIDPQTHAGCCGLSCRTYSDKGKLRNAPPRELIESAIRRDSRTAKLPTAIAPILATITALASIACCLPFGIAAALGSIGLSFYLEKHRGIVLTIATALLLLQVWQLYRQRKRFGKTSTVGKVVLGFSAIVVLVMIVAPDQVALALSRL